jgi:hypothetical protein
MAVDDFLKNHKHLVIVLIAAIVFVFIGSKWIDHQENVAKLQADSAHQILAVQESKNEELKNIVADQSKKYDQILSQVTAQNTTLLQELSNRQVALRKQKTINQTSTLPELTGHWQTLTNTSSSDFSISDGKISISESAARITVNGLDERAVLQKDIADKDQLLNNKESLLNGLQNVNTSLKDQVNGLNIQITDQNNSCTAEKKVLQAQIKKAKRNTFFAYLAAAGSIALKVLVK